MEDGGWRMEAGVRRRDDPHGCPTWPISCRGLPPRWLEVKHGKSSKALSASARVSTRAESSTSRSPSRTLVAVGRSETTNLRKRSPCPKCVPLDSVGRGQPARSARLDDNDRQFSWSRFNGRNSTLPRPLPFQNPCHIKPVGVRPVGWRFSP